MNRGMLVPRSSEIVDVVEKVKGVKTDEEYLVSCPLCPPFP